MRIVGATMVSVADLKVGDVVATHLYHESDNTKMPFSTAIGTLSRIVREDDSDIVTVYLAMGCDFGGHDENLNVMLDAGWGTDREVEFGASTSSKVARLTFEGREFPSVVKEREAVKSRWDRKMPRGVSAFVQMGEVGALKDGDEFYFAQRRLGKTHMFTYVATPHKRGLRGPSHKVYTSPSGAAKSVAKNITNGWDCLRSSKTGKSLGEMLDELNASLDSN